MDTVLSIKDLTVAFKTDHGETVAVDRVSFELERGKTLAVVGESGSGKSVTSYSILRLIQKPGYIKSGQILLYPKSGGSIDITSLSERDDTLYKIRGGLISMIFQEPMTALSPVHSIGDQLTEAILIHQSVTKHEADQLAIEMLAKVGIPKPEDRLKQYPHEFSGGMRQRVVIAMALVCRPEVLIADEPTTALDVTIQAQILELIRELREEMGTSVLFITHDLGVVAQVADDIVVMNRSRVMEQAPVLDLYDNPVHPYTKGLLASMPRLDREEKRLQGVAVEEAGIEGIPDHLSIKPEEAKVGADPILHEIGDRRKILLWPKK